MAPISRDNSGIDKGHASLHVLIVADWPSGGGVISVMRDIAIELRGRVRFDVFFFHSGIEPSPWGEFCEEVIYDGATTLSEVLVRGRYDIVHLIDSACQAIYGPEIWIERARFLGGIVCNFHILDPVVPSGLRADVFVAASDAAAAAATAQGHVPVDVVWNGIDSETFRRIDISGQTVRPVVAWVGRASDPRKGFELLREATPVILSHGFDVWIASPEPMPKELEITQVNQSRICWFSSLRYADMPEFYSAVAASGGVVISTSRSEAFQLTLLEGASCGCVPIAPHAQWSNYLTHGSNAVLYERDQGSPALLDAILSTRDPMLRNCLIDGAYDLVQSKHNARQMAEGYYGAYIQAHATAMKRGKLSAVDLLVRTTWLLGARLRRVYIRLKQTLKARAGHLSWVW